MNQVAVERGRKWAFSELPHKSIALDGAVAGPLIDNINKKYSFDHHGNCIRHISSATCIQVLDALLLGFDPEGYTIYVNDVDGDTVLSLALLLKPELSKSSYVQMIVRVIGIIDSHGPSYPLNEKEEKILNIFMNNVVDKVYQLKKDKKYGEYDLRTLIFECIDKFHKMLECNFENYEKKELEIVTYKESPNTNSDWYMIETNSRNIFSYLYKNGYTKIVVWQQLPDNSYAYSIAKKSEFVDFPIKNILEKLNFLESGWGGSSTIGGAPRNIDGSRSKLKPEEVVIIINALVTTPTT